MSGRESITAAGRLVRQTSRRSMNKSERESVRENRRKRLVHGSEGMKDESKNNRLSRSRTTEGVIRSSTRSSGRQRTRSTRRSAGEPLRNSENGSRRPRSSRIRTVKTGEEEETIRVPAPERRSFSKKKRGSASAATKDLLKNLPNEEEEDEEEEVEQGESITLSSLSQGIRRASTVHYTHRDVSGNRRGDTRSMSSSLHSSLSALDHSGRHHHHHHHHGTGSMSRSSRHGCRHSTGGGTRRHRRRREGHRRSKELQQRQHLTQEDDTTCTASTVMDDDSIRVLQFDYSRTDGLNVVDANNVHSKSSRNSYVDQLTVLLPEDLSVAVTEDTASLENSLSSNINPIDFYGEERPLMLTSEDNMTTDNENDDEEAEEEVREGTKYKGKKAKQAFKAVSKLLATPMTRRKTVALTTDLMDMSMASLHI